MADTTDYSQSEIAQAQRQGAGKGAAQGAMFGASLGTTIMPGWGTVIGTGVGALVGALAGSASAKKSDKERQKAEAEFEQAQRQQAVIASGEEMKANKQAQAYANTPSNDIITRAASGGSSYDAWSGATFG